MNFDFPGYHLIRVPLKYGLIVGFLFSIQINLQHIVRNHWLGIDLYSSYFSLVILFGGIAAGIFEKGKYYEGKMSYLISLQTGLLIGLCASIFTSFFMYIYSEYINTDWVDMMNEKLTNDLLNQGKTDMGEIKHVLKESLKQYSTRAQVYKQFAVTMCGSAVFSLIIPMLVKGGKSYNSDSRNHF